MANNAATAASGRHRQDSDSLRLFGESEMGARIRAFDWSKTPLGRMELWPQSLRTAVQIMLASRYPMFVWWGDALTNLYNDHQIAVHGKRHPQALGWPAAQVWAEVWEILRPQTDAVLREGNSTWNEEVLLPLERNGFPEETYFTFSFSPIAAEDGSIAGLFGVCTEDTAKVLARRRLKTLRDLGQRTLQESRTVEQAIGAAAVTLADNPHDIPFALIYRVNKEGTRAHLVESVRAENARVPAEVRLNGQSDLWNFGTVLQTAKTRTVEDLGGKIGQVVAGAWPEPIERATIVPLAKSGIQDTPAGFLVAGLSRRLPVDDDYCGFLELAGGQIATAIANARAYEEERQRARALADIDRAKTAFFSNVSHEFRTPLTLLLGPLEDTLALHAGLPPDVHEALTVAHRNSLRLLRLVNSLLDFSRIEAGRMNASFEQTDLGKFTAGLASTFRSATERAGLSLTVECPPLAEPVYVDRDMWEKIVLNLLSNAFKFTFEGGIAVRLKALGSKVELTVTDTGTGIPAHEIPHLFERFHRVEGAKGRTLEGTGIGLALVGELVGIHGGSVRLESAVGRGSAFTVSVPFGTEHLPPQFVMGSHRPSSTSVRADAFVQEALRWLPEDSIAPESAASSAPVDGEDDCTATEPSSGKSGRVLVVDDSADMRAYLRRLLRPDYHVVTVTDGEEALRLARAGQADLVLSDITVPVLDGFGLLRALRSDPITRTIPVILLSARAGEEARSEGMEAGADDYLVKPFAARELLARVSAHLALTRARTEVEQQATRILESITDGFAALDADWRFTYVNAEAERLNGMKREDMLGKSHWDLFPASIGTTVYKELHRAAAERVPVDFENYYAPWDRWFHVKAYPTVGLGISIFYQDITERKRAQESLARNQKRQEFLLELMDSLRALSDPLEIQYEAARALAEYVGANRAGFAEHQADGEMFAVRRQYAHSVPNVQGFYRYDDYGPELLQAFKTGRTVVRNDIANDSTLTDAEKKSHALLQLGATVNVPLLKNGRLGAVMFMHFREARSWTAGEVELLEEVAARTWDAVLRARAEEALTRSEEQFRWLAHAIPNLAWMADEAGWIFWYNQRWYDYTGTTPEQMEGWGWQSVHDPEILPAVLERWKESLACAKTFEMVFPLKGADGRFRPFLTRVEPIRDSSGKVVRWFGSNTDIEAQSQAEERLRAAVLGSPNPLMLHADDGEILALSRSWTDLTGYGKEEISTHHDWFSLAYPGRHEELLAQMLEREFASAEVVRVGEITVRTKGGGERIWDFQAVPLGQLPDGRRLQLSAAVDVTERTHAEAALRESEERFRAAVQTVRGLMWTNNARGEMEGEQPGWAAFTGQSYDEYRGYGWSKAVHPDDAQPTIDAWQEALAEQRMFVFEHRVRRHDGVWRRFSIRALPVLDRQGQIREWVGVHTDITDERQLLDALRESEAQFRQMADSMPQIVWTADSAGRIDYVNERWQEYTGSPQYDALQGGRVSSIHPEDRTRVVDHWAAHVAAGEPAEVEFRLRRREGVYRWVLSRGLPSRDEQGRIVKWYGTATDIDEQKRVEEELRRANHDLEQFAYSASHDLQEPLRNIAVYSQLFQKRYGDKLDARADQFLEYIIEGAQRMSLLVSDLLAYTQAARLSDEEVPSLVDSGRVLQRVLASLQCAIEENCAAVTHDSLPVVPVKEVHLQQLLQNLIGNAIKYRKDGEPARVHVAAVPEGSLWRFSVADNGIGIDPQYHAQVFGLFKRLHARGSKYEGTGIGLSICQKIVERYGGRIWLESEHGKGTTFSFTLPRALLS